MKHYAQLGFTILGTMSLFGVVLLISAIGGAWQQRIAAKDPSPDHSKRYAQLQASRSLIADAPPTLHLEASPLLSAMRAEAEGRAADAHLAMAAVALAEGYPQLSELHRAAAQEKE